MPSTSPLQSPQAASSSPAAWTCEPRRLEQVSGPSHPLPGSGPQGTQWGPSLQPTNEAASSRQRVPFLQVKAERGRLSSTAAQSGQLELHGAPGLRLAQEYSPCVAGTSVDPSPQGDPRWPGQGLAQALPLTRYASPTSGSTGPGASASFFLCCWLQATGLAWRSSRPPGGPRGRSPSKHSAPQAGTGLPCHTAGCVFPPPHCLAPALAAPSLPVLQRQPCGARGPTHHASSSSSASSSFFIS